MSNNSNHLNEVIKVLTVIATIFTPLTFIANFLVTNLVYLPLVHRQSGWWLSVGAMVAAVVYVVLYFKLKRWL